MPGTPVPDVSTLEGTPEIRDDVTGVLRWWPASGVDLSATLGYGRTHDAEHVPGAERRLARAGISVRWTR